MKSLRRIRSAAYSKGGNVPNYYFNFSDANSVLQPLFFFALGGIIFLALVGWAFFTVFYLVKLRAERPEEEKEPVVVPKAERLARRKSAGWKLTSTEATGGSNVAR